jgi:hypothetical protein
MSAYMKAAARVVRWAAPMVVPMASSSAVVKVVLWADLLVAWKVVHLAVE